MIFKILILIFIAFAASRAFLRFKDKSLNILNLIFWIILWCVILIIVFKPQISDEFSYFLGIQHGTDAAFFFANLILFYLVFRLYVKIENVDRDITRLATNISKKLHVKNPDGE